MRLIVATAFLFVSLAVSAQAACMKPFGVYVGSGEYKAYKNGTFGYGTMQLSINVPTRGDWQTSFWLNDLKDGTNASTGTFPAIGTSGNSFDMKTCRGQMQAGGGGGVFNYLMSDSGNGMTLMLYQKINPSFIWIVSLRKV